MITLRIIEEWIEKMFIFASFMIKICYRTNFISSSISIRFN